MSDLHVPVGTVPGYGGDLEVCRHPDGSAAIWVPTGQLSVCVPPESVAKLAELLHRAAMPGQEEARTWPCCGHCTRRPCAGHPYACADGCNGAEGGHG